MSGGSFDYGYSHVDMLADEIERKLVSDCRRPGDKWDDGYDYLNDCTPEQRETVKAEMTSLMNDLRRNAKRARELEWYFSGDHSADSYLRIIREDEELQSRKAAER